MISAAIIYKHQTRNARQIFNLAKVLVDISRSQKHTARRGDDNSARDTLPQPLRICGVSWYFAQLEFGS